MRLKFVLILALASSLLIPVATSQAANVLNFSAKQPFVTVLREGDHFVIVNGKEVPFVKGRQLSSAELRREKEHLCGENYSSPTLSVKGASGDLGRHPLGSSSSISSAKWTVNSKGKNVYLIFGSCKQWGKFLIPNSDGYQFNLKFKSINPYLEKIPSSPWYSKGYLSQNQWNVSYFNNLHEWGFSYITEEYGDDSYFRSRWLPRPELPAMPAIRVLSVNDDDPIFRLTSMEISGGQFTSTPTSGWNKWTLQFTDYFSLPGIPGRRKYSAEHVDTFTWVLKVLKNEVPAPNYEIAVTQTGYRHSSQVGNFVIPPVGEIVQLVEVHRTPEGAKIGD